VTEKSTEVIYSPCQGVPSRGVPSWGVPSRGVHSDQELFKISLELGRNYNVQILN